LGVSSVTVPRGRGKKLKGGIACKCFGGEKKAQAPRKKRREAQGYIKGDIVSESV